VEVLESVGQKVTACWLLEMFTSECDHFSGKPGNVGEFCSRQGNARKLAFCWGIVRGKILPGKAIVF